MLAITELVTNVIRHSSGQICTIHFDESADVYRVQITDDGGHAEVQSGNGLLGVKQRIQELGGSVEVSTARGCAVALELPKVNGATT